jgi:hypothetical protein
MHTSITPEIHPTSKQKKKRGKKEIKKKALLSVVSMLTSLAAPIMLKE